MILQNSFFKAADLFSGRGDEFSRFSRHQRGNVSSQPEADWPESFGIARLMGL